MVAVTLYVEGGGDAKSLRTACRQGFSTFLAKAGVMTAELRIVACGGRASAYKDFRKAIAAGNPAMLLVDSEEPVSQAYQQGEPEGWLPWQHLAQRVGDRWQKPDDARELHCHLMVQCMESWLVADRDTLERFFGPSFKGNQLPDANVPIESVIKTKLYDGLKSATQSRKIRAPYGKGRHSFRILAQINPEKVQAASPWARRFVDEMKRRMGS